MNMTTKLVKKIINGYFIMNKEKILNLAKKENKGEDIADLYAQQKGTWFAYIFGVCGIILVDIINGLIFKSTNHGVNMIITGMATIAFLVKYKTLKKRHELIIAIIFSLLTVMFMVFWILQLIKVW